MGLARAGGSRRDCALKNLIPGSVMGTQRLASESAGVGRQIRREQAEQTGRRMSAGDLAALVALDSQLKPYVAKLRQSMVHPSNKARVPCCLQCPSPVWQGWVGDVDIRVTSSCLPLHCTFCLDKKTSLQTHTCVCAERLCTLHIIIHECAAQHRGHGHFRAAMPGLSRYIMQG